MSQATRTKSKRQPPRYVFHFNDRYHRAMYKVLEVMGITGHQAKVIRKEIYDVLEARGWPMQYNITKNIGGYQRLIACIRTRT